LTAKTFAVVRKERLFSLQIHHESMLAMLEVATLSYLQIYRRVRSSKKETFLKFFGPSFTHF